LNVVGKLLSLVKGRLALIGVGLALTVIAGLWFHAGTLSRKLESAETRASIALAANASNQITIDALRDAAVRDAARLRELDSVLTGIAQASAERRDTRERIATNDQTVADYLNQPVPCGLRDAASGDADCPGPD
jgi:hypothetical protein